MSHKYNRMVILFELFLTFNGLLIGAYFPEISFWPHFRQSVPQPEDLGLNIVPISVKYNTVSVNIKNFGVELYCYSFNYL